MENNGIVVDQLVRHEYPIDPPTESGYYLVAYGSEEYPSEDWSIDILEYMLDPMYEKSLWNETANQFCPNPEPQRWGWFDQFDFGSWTEYTNDVKYWWKTPVVKKRRY